MNRNQIHLKIMEAAKEYLDMGMPIIPLCSHDHEEMIELHTNKCNKPGKRPLLKGWQDHTETTLTEFGEWRKKYKKFNLGLPLGHISGYVGIDVDGEGGEDMLEEMSDGDVPDTWEYSTGEGRRLLYEIPVGFLTKKFVNADKTQEHTECSILAYGQQTVLPPSMHATGRQYTWIEGKSPDDMDCSPAPGWLLELVRDERAEQRKGVIDLTSANPSYERSDEITFTEDPVDVRTESLDLEFSNPLEEFITATPAGAPVKEPRGRKEKPANKRTEDFEVDVSEGGRDNHMMQYIGHLCAKYRTLGKDAIMAMAHSLNQRRMQPPLDTKDVESKVNHIWVSEEQKSAEYAKKSKGEDLNDFVPDEIAQVALNLAENNGLVYKMDMEKDILWVTHRNIGPWKPIQAKGDSHEMMRYIKPALTDPSLGGDPTWGRIRNFQEVTNMLKFNLRDAGRVWPTDATTFDTQSFGAYDEIPVAGGKLLNWRTLEVRNWDPETHLTYVIPIEYDPKATCPNWMMRLEEWLPEKGSRDIIQEFIGYTLIPYMGFEKALMFKGEGANGKSMLLNTIERMFGREVTSSVDLSMLLTKQFGQINLLGKIVNIVNEAGIDYIKGPTADTFKNMVSGGMITADVKNRDPVRFANTAKFIFASNSDLDAQDKSFGWERRLIRIPFEQDFSQSGVSSSEITRSFDNEFPGIFNWAIEGLRRLMDNKKFSESAAVSKAAKDYQNNNNIVAAFVDNCVTVGVQFEVDGKLKSWATPKKLMKDLFEVWTNYRERPMKKFRDNLADHLAKKMKIQEGRVEGKYIKHYKTSKTLCWKNVIIDIKDPEFLEYILDDDEEGNEKIRMSTAYVTFIDYARERLKNWDDDPTPPSPPNISVQDKEAM